jgi:bifunctional non-homologous end joining protein LigD
MSAPRAPISVSNPGKLMFPAIGLTKGGLIDYYERIAPLLLPHIRDRPLTLERLPDGLTGDGAKRFWQKNTPAHYPSWIPRVNLPNEDGKPVHYALCNDVETLRYLVNQGAVTFHIWLSRVGAAPDSPDSIDRPDCVLFDLDPGSAPFADVITLAHLLRTALRSAGHEVFIKTSGKSGLHLLVPWKQAGGFTESRAFATAISRSVITQRPELATLEIRKEKRGGKIYLDVMQNVRGHHVVPAYTVRAVPAATVSMPLEWDEVRADLDPSRFTIAEALTRAASGDPIARLCSP